jgi:hypothetical protein
MESHERYEQLIDELILSDEGSEESSPKWQTLRAHLMGCPRCRERYDRVSLAERMLHGGPAALAVPSPASFERIGAAVLAQSTARPPAWQRMVQWFAPPQRWAMGLATAALAVLVPFFVAHKSGEGEFQARGATRSERLAGVRAFCLDAGGVTPRCTRSSQLRLTVSNAGKFRYMFLLGLDEAHAIKWYAPRPPDPASVAAPLGNDMPVGDAVRLGINHDPGPVRVYAIFSDAPVTTMEIEAAVDEMRQRALSPSKADALPLRRTDVVQHSVAFDVAP